MNRSSASMSVSSRTARSDSVNLPEFSASSGASKNESRSSIEERKQRKREQDRMCQRRKREKDKANLRRLEARLDGLQTADESKTVLDLILRHEQDQSKIDRQVDRLRQLQSVLAAGLADLAKDKATASTISKEYDSQLDDVADSTGDQPSTAKASDVSDMNPDLGGIPSMMPSTAVFDNMSANSAVYNAPPAYNTYPSANKAESVVYGPQSGSESHVPTAPWIVAGQLLQDACAKAHRSGRVSTVDALDQHAILTTVLHGWDYSIATLNLTHPLWQCLKQVDDAALSTMKFVERVMALWLMWLVFRASAQGPQAMAQIQPKFLRPRPSQLSFPNRRKDIDCFPWPGARERLVFEEQKYYSQEAFLRVFTHSVCFVWPFEDINSFYKDKETGMLHFSSQILRHFNNVNCWSVNATFLNAYPEFRGDMPTYNSIPPQIEDKGAGGQDYYFHDEEDAVMLPVRQPWNYNGGGYIVGPTQPLIM